MREKKLKKIIQNILLISPGIIYLLFFIIDYFFKFNISDLDILTFFFEINDKLPFGYIVSPFFVPCLLYSIIIYILWITVFSENKKNKLNYLEGLVSFGSLFAGIVFSLFFIFVIGMYSIIVKGEYL